MDIKLLVSYNSWDETIIDRNGEWICCDVESVIATDIILALNEREQLLCDLLVAKRRIQMIDEELLCNTDKDAAIAIVRKLCKEFMN